MKKDDCKEEENVKLGYDCQLSVIEKVFNPDPDFRYIHFDFSLYRENIENKIFIQTLL